MRTVGNARSWQSLVSKLQCVQQILRAYAVMSRNVLKDSIQETHLQITVGRHGNMVLAVLSCR